MSLHLPGFSLEMTLVPAKKTDLWRVCGIWKVDNSTQNSKGMRLNHLNKRSSNCHPTHSCCTLISPEPIRADRSFRISNLHMPQCDIGGNFWSKVCPWSNDAMYFCFHWSSAQMSAPPKLLCTPSHSAGKPDVGWTPPINEIKPGIAPLKIISYSTSSIKQPTSLSFSAPPCPFLSQSIFPFLCQWVSQTLSLFADTGLGLLACLMQQQPEPRQDAAVGQREPIKSKFLCQDLVLWNIAHNVKPTDRSAKDTWRARSCDKGLVRCLKKHFLVRTEALKGRKGVCGCGLADLGWIPQNNNKRLCSVRESQIMAWQCEICWDSPNKQTTKARQCDSSQKVAASVKIKFEVTSTTNMRLGMWERHKWPDSSGFPPIPRDFRGFPPPPQRKRLQAEWLGAPRKKV